MCGWRVNSAAVELRVPDPAGRFSGRNWTRLGFGVGLAAVAAAAVVVPAYLTVPKRNNTDDKVDCLLVLGSPTEIDGTATEAQRWRVDEAVREYRAGRAPRMLMTGGMTVMHFTESHTMAEYALQHGVPPAAVLEEPHAKTTLENIRNSQAILDAHGWHRVEVISSPEHLPRTALLLEHSDLQWRTHAAPTPGRSHLQEAGAYAEEAVGTAIMRLFGPGIEPLLHGVATVQHAVAFAVRWVMYKAEGRILPRGDRAGA